MKGNCKHDVALTNNDVVYDQSLRTYVTEEYGHPSVSLANDDDPHYHQVFETAEELDQFIRQLVDARREAFGDHKTWHFDS